MGLSFPLLKPLWKQKSLWGSLLGGPQAQTLAFWFHPCPKREQHNNKDRLTGGRAIVGEEGLSEEQDEKGGDLRVTGHRTVSPGVAKETYSTWRLPSSRV